MVRTEKDASLAKIIAEQRERSFRTYGYRRMWMVLEKQGIHRNPKTILRIMEKYNLLAEIRRRRKWVNMGQQIHKYENLLNRQFHADRPNSKWVTDISYIHTKQGVLYLSMIRDLYDNSIVAYKTGTQQTVNLVLDTIRLAMKREKKKSRCGAPLPQRPGISVHLASILQPNTSIRHYSVNVKERKSVWQRDGRKLLLYFENWMYLPAETNNFFRSKWNDWALYPFLQLWAHPVKDWRGAAWATPLRIKLHIFPT